MARPPQPRAGGPTVRSAPNPFTQFAANVEGYTRDRAHQGLDTIRRAASAPPDLSDAFSVFGITPRVAKEVGGAVGVLTSPGGGVGDAVGTSMWNNPGDPRGRRLGDLAQALTPIGPGKVVKGVTDAAKLTRGAANGLMRPYFARRTAQMAEEAASPSFAPLSRATSPNVGSSVTPHQQAAAAWEKVDDLHQRGETDPGVLMAASNDAVTQSRALGVPITGNARDMVGAHLEPADPAPATQLALSRRGFLGGAAAAGAGAVVAAHALPDILKATAPGLHDASTWASEIAAEDAPATANLAVLLHKHASSAWDNVKEMLSAGEPEADIRTAAQYADGITGRALKASKEVQAADSSHPGVDEFQEMIDDPFMTPEGGHDFASEVEARAEAHAMMAESHVTSENINEIQREYGPEAAKNANIGWGVGDDGSVASKVYHPDGNIVVQSYFDPHSGEIVHDHTGD